MCVVFSIRAICGREDEYWISRRSKDTQNSSCLVEYYIWQTSALTGSKVDLLGKEIVEMGI
jgi:hypothetical protein